MKLTKVETKWHERALELLQSSNVATEYIDCPLCGGRGCDECDGGKIPAARFVLRHYHPGAVNNVGKGGIFFTPEGMARDTALYHSGGGRVVDACAGIGALSYWLTNYATRPIELTCIEINPDFVEVGKKLVPSATWICGDLWDVLPTLPEFESGISNPPFGTVYSNQCKDFGSCAHMAVCSLLAKHCRHGAIVIIPANDHSREDQQFQDPSQNYRRFRSLHPQAHITPGPFDLSAYKFKGAAPKVQICDLHIEPVETPV